MNSQHIPIQSYWISRVEVSLPH
uniref:Uncharacterized protein n=1 Tax=Anguilla anguilla TaxID=7936 RepID=A0A0E9RVU3_ANGAN